MQNNILDPVLGLYNSRDMSIMLPRKNKSAEAQNIYQYRENLRHAIELYQNMFKWSGPDTINYRYLEYILITEGKALLFNDTKAGIGHMALPYGHDGELDVYYEPTKMRVYGNRYMHTYDRKNSVICRNTIGAYPSIYAIQLWAAKLTDADRTIDVYAKTLKRPWAVSGDKDTALTHKIITDAIEGNELEVILNGQNATSRDLDVFKNSNNGSTLIDLWTHRTNVNSVALTKAGIATANTDKKERMVVDEANSNNQYTEINAYNLLEFRKLACDEFNAMFNPDIPLSVEFNEQYGIPEGSQFDGKVYAGTENAD